jgi:hypothetical protein
MGPFTVDGIPSEELEFGKRVRCIGLKNAEKSCVLIVIKIRLQTGLTVEMWILLRIPVLYYVQEVYIYAW